MRKFLMLPLAVAATALAAAAAGADGAGAGSGSSSPSVAGFVSLATAGIHSDFTPLVSPKDAVDKADLIVEGTLADVVDGIALRFPDARYTQRAADSYVTLVLDVTRVIDGDPAKVSGGKVYVVLAKSAMVTRAQLAAANPHPTIVAVLEDITTWSPAPGVTVNRPATIPSNATLYAAYTDGMWLQASGDTEMHGLGAHQEEFSPAWGSPHRVDEISAALHGAAGK